MAAANWTSSGTLELAQLGQPPVQRLGGAGLVAAVEDQPDALGGDPSAGELFVTGVAGVESGQQSRSGAVGVMVIGAAQQSADVIQWVAGAATTPGLLPLDAAAHLVNSGESQAHDVEGVQDTHDVRQTSHAVRRCSPNRGLARPLRCRPAAGIALVYPTTSADAL